MFGIPRAIINPMIFVNAKKRRCSLSIANASKAEGTREGEK
jgi:hypothetical protein